SRSGHRWQHLHYREIPYHSRRCQDIQSCWTSDNRASQLLRWIFPLGSERFSYVSTKRARPMGSTYRPFQRALSTQRARSDKSTQLRTETLQSAYNFLQSSIEEQRKRL